MPFLDAVGVTEYCCTAVQIAWQLCASRCLREQRLDEPSFQRERGLGLDESCQRATFVEFCSAESHQSYRRRSRCWQHGIDTTSCDTRSSRAELGMRHADLLRKATVIATPASAPCMLTGLPGGVSGYPRARYR